MKISFFFLNIIFNISEKRSENSSIPSEVNYYRNQAQATKISRKKSFTLPWWFKIIAYIASYACMTVSVFFIIVKGIEFGSEKVTKWLTSLLVSFLSSVLITQPAQVILLALLLVLIFRRYDDKSDFEMDHEDDGRSMNINTKWHNLEQNKELFGTEANIKSLSLLEQAELEEARRARLKKVRMMKALQEIVIYLIFLASLFIVTYSNYGISSYNYQRTIKNMLAPIDTDSRNDFNKVSHANIVQYDCV
jgi:hypothetical protein